MPSAEPVAGRVPNHPARWRNALYPLDFSSDPRRPRRAASHCGATQDISEQVKASELLRESEERLQNAESALLMWGVGTGISRSDHVAWSEEMFRIFGKPQDYTPDYEGFLQAIVPQDRGTSGTIE